MSHWIDITAMVLAGLLLVPVLVLCVECLAALLSPRRHMTNPIIPRPTLVILIPAHNEEVSLPMTLRSVAAQVLPHDRIIVVVDNCTDNTANVARDNGAIAIERQDASRRGKGFALDRGIRELESDPPAAVVMIDADCRLAEGALDALATQAIRTGQPAQAAYIMDCPRDAGQRAGISALAFIVKNVVRPLGLRQLHLPCLLTGTGMAFPWEVIRDAPLASGNIVEDMQLGLDLAIAGHAPRACPEALVVGTIEKQSAVAYTQRKRWEHGHLATLLVNAPRLAISAIRQLSPRLFALCLEVAVPPVALLVLLLLGGLICAIGWASFGGSTLPAIMLICGSVLLFISLFSAWARFARHVVPLRSLLAIPLYVAWKMPLYFAFLIRRQKQWVRTFRRNDPASASCVLKTHSA